MATVDLDLEDAQRRRVRDEARSWLGTPYHHLGALRGVGCDCAQLIIQTFADAGLIERITPPRYSPTWHLHRNEEMYLHHLEEYIHPGDNDERSFDQRIKEDGSWHTGMGDILMFKLGRTFSHSAIVTDWPKIIHSSLPVSMVEEVDIHGTPMAQLPMRVYSYWGTR